MNDKKKWDPFEPPRSVREMICALSVFHKMLAAACVSAIFLAIGLGLNALAEPEVPPFVGSLKTLTAVIKSVPYPLDEDRSIAFYRAKIEREEGISPSSVYFYARTADCPSKNLSVGREVRLALEELKPGYRVRRAETIEGCLIYDSRLESEVWANKKRTNTAFVWYFFGISIVTFAVSLFYFRKFMVRV